MSPLDHSWVQLGRLITIDLYRNKWVISKLGTYIEIPTYIDIPTCIEIRSLKKFNAAHGKKAVSWLGRVSHGSKLKSKMPSIFPELFILLSPEIHKFSALSDRATRICGSILCSAHLHERKIRAKQSKSALLFGFGIGITSPSHMNDLAGKTPDLYRNSADERSRG
jgi:hypothetical protein